MRIKCPICRAEYEEGTVKFCKICMYSIGTDVYLTNLLNRPSPDDLKRYNQSLEEFRALWEERKEEQQRIVDALVKRDQEKEIGTARPAIEKGLIEMVEVEGWTFLMGGTPDQGDEARDSEKPVHKVTLDSFYIGKYPVTQDQYEEIMKEMPSEFVGL